MGDPVLGHHHTGKGVLRSCHAPVGCPHPTLEQMREIWIIGAASSAPAAAEPPAGLVPSQPSPCLDILAP